MSNECKKCGRGPMQGPRYENGSLIYKCAVCGYREARPPKDRMQGSARTRQVWLVLLALLLLAAPAYASGYHDDECREIRECVKQPACIQSDWRWYAARNRSCEPAGHVK
jgi:hypothetical protein